jgi:hypothetical protein
VLSLAAGEGAGAVLDALVGLVTAAEADNKAHVADLLAALRAQTGQAR